jgi:hypothetical protein
MRLPKIIHFILLLGLISCREQEMDLNKDYKRKFVVEGWIEHNEYPNVQLTHNAPFFTSLDSAMLDQLVIRWAKVTISDGENTEVLTARRDTNLFPPFTYRGTEIKGIAGRTYTLTVEYAGNTLKSVTTIPGTVPLDSIWFEKAGSTDTLVQLNIRFKDKALEKNFYKLYTKTLKDKQFTPTLLSNQNDKYFNGKELTLQVNRGPKNNLTVKNEPYFRIGDTVLVKFSSIPESGYEFWSSFQNEVLGSSNPLIGSTRAVKSNIEGPGVGIWCGYGSVIYKVVAKD